MHMHGVRFLFYGILFFTTSCQETGDRLFKKTNLVEDTAAVITYSPTANPGKAKTFIKQHGYNEAICFFINMNIPSGKKRFFVFDLKKDTIITSGLVAHGSCNTSFLKEPVYSNKPNSGCSSFGKYKIGNKYTGRFGYAYKLYGLDSSNSNAFERAIVLHSYECVPDNELIEAAICNSLGCPMISPKFLKQLSVFIDSSKKPLLLWIYSG